MTISLAWGLFFVVPTHMSGSACAADGERVAGAVWPEARVVRDALWVWGNPEMTQPGKATAARFANCSPSQRAEILGVPNVVMAGPGLPHDRKLAAQWSADIVDAQRLVWEIMSDGDAKQQPAFEFKRRIADLAPLVEDYPQIGAVLIDDMTSVAASKGFKPEQLRSIKRLLAQHDLSLKLWGVLYTMNFPNESTDPLVRELDGINLWHWHARDTSRMEEHVAECEKRYPDKPITLGIYMYDYGGGRRMPLDVHERQCQTALKLLHQQRIKGIVFLSITDDEKIVSWTADWVARVAGQTIGTPQQASTISAATALVKSSKRQSEHLHIGDGAGWSFSGDRWSESADGVISPPDERNLHSRAFHTTQSFGDLTADFEFNGNYRETGSGGAGLIFRARDPTHFYMVYFPWGGQQLRAKHFWASIVKADGTGHLRSLKSTWVPGVPSETDRWYKIRLKVTGPTMELWVDGRRALSVEDDSYQRGAVGLAGYGWYFFRNVQIDGQGEPLAAWDEAQQIPVHHFTVGLDSQTMPSGCLAPNGDVLLAAGNKLVRSRDRGRTWQEPEALPDKLGSVTDYGNTMFRTSSGRLIVQTYRNRTDTGKPVPEISIAESTDNGATWSDPVPSHVAEGWPEKPPQLVPYGPLLETADGTLIRFLLGGVKEPTDFTNVITWSAVHAKAFAMRSTDGGQSWSAPIEMDQPAWSGMPRGTIPGSLDFTEPTGVAIGNRLTVLIRPIYSHAMWQCWSEDAGATWDAASRATFPGYAQSAVRTRSGAILVAHRYPHYSVNISRDDGLNWDDGTIIDYAFWGMGCLVEVEPDVVLCTYMNAQRDLPLLGQLLRVTPEGVRPVAED